VSKTRANRQSQTRTASVDLLDQLFY